jgi:hypothetical protein
MIIAVVGLGQQGINDIAKQFLNDSVMVEALYNEEHK